MAMAIAAVAISLVLAVVLLAPSKSKAPVAEGKNSSILFHTDKESYTFGDSLRVTLENRGNATLYFSTICGGQIRLEYLNGSVWEAYEAYPDGIAFYDKYRKLMNFSCGAPTENETVLESSFAPGDIVEYQMETMQGPVYRMPIGKFRLNAIVHLGCGDFNIKQDGLIYARCGGNSTLLSNEFTVSPPAYPT